MTLSINDSQHKVTLSVAVFIAMLSVIMTCVVMPSGGVLSVMASFDGRNGGRGTVSLATHTGL